MKKLRKILFWLFAIVYLIFALAFTSDKYFELKCKNINVLIIDSIENSFIHNKDIVKFLSSPGKNVIGYPMELINTEKLEEILSSHPSIISAEIFKTVNGSINVIIDQRDPLIRIFPKNGKSFYIDESGKIMPLSDKYASHLIVASGEINANFDLDKSIDLFSLNSKVLKDLFEMGNYLKGDVFWNSQIEQVYVKQNGDFELIPRIGSQVILIGEVDNIQQKLQNLKEVYKQGFSKESWTKYKYINLKYNNQVICTKR